MSRKKAFTLVQLVTVLFVISLFATVAVSTVRRHALKRAIVQEAIMGLSATRTSYLVHLKKYEGYKPELFKSGYIGLNNYYPEGIRAGDLNGTYFSENCYYFMRGTVTTTAIYCYVSPPVNGPNKAPKASQTIAILGSGKYITMRVNDGNLRTTIPGLPWYSTSNYGWTLP